MVLQEGTSQVKHTTWSAGLSVSADGRGVVAHAGSVAVRLLADRTGLTGALSAVLQRRSFVPVHDRGRPRCGRGCQRCRAPTSAHWNERVAARTLGEGEGAATLSP